MLANFGSSATNMDGNNANSGGTSSFTPGGVDSGGPNSQLGGSGMIESGGANSGGVDPREQKEAENKHAQQQQQQPVYSMPGILHFIQHEWSRYELERAQWEIERSELKARISFLIGERKSQENLKHDLVRRIKMLEHALKQERAKYQKMTQSNEQSQNGEANPGEMADDQQQNFPPSAAKSSVPLDIDAIVPPVLPKSNDGKTSQSQTAAATGEVINQEWAKAREMLRQYLQEIGYAEKILEVRSFRVKQLFGVLPGDKQLPAGDRDSSRLSNVERAMLENEQIILDTADSIKQHRTAGAHPPTAEKQQKTAPGNKKMRADDDSDSSSGGDGEGDLDADAVEAFNEFSFLKHEMQQEKAQLLKQQQAHPPTKESLEAMKERLKSDQERRRQQSKQASKDEPQVQQSLMTATSKFFDAANSPTKQPRNISVDTVHGIPPNTVTVDAAPFEEDKFEGTKAGYEDDEDEQAQQVRWSINYTLRSHYDSIRAMQFHPVENVLITASEDGTAKLWDLNHSSVAAGGKSGGTGNDGSGSGKASSSQFPQPATGIVDIEPVYTFRGHRGPILALDMSPLGETCYTAGHDGVICCWNVPSTIGLDIYQNFDPTVLLERLRGHTDIVWALNFHSSSNRLISASADGTIRIWIVGLADGAMPSPLLKTITEPARPHSIDLVSTETQHLLSACARAQCHILDIETGQRVVQFQMRESGGEEEPGEINKILSHPTMPVTAGEDRKIRFFDNNTGKLINSTMAHVEGVSTLAIDPNGLYLLSGSHDGSVRLWNAEKRICLQEIAAHRKKLGSGVMAVAFHPSRQLIGSAGADSLAKVYGTVRGSPRSSLISASPPSSSSGSSGPSSLVGSPQKQQPPHIASSQL